MPAINGKEPGFVKDGFNTLETITEAVNVNQRVFARDIVNGRFRGGEDACRVSLDKIVEEVLVVNDAFWGLLIVIIRKVFNVRAEIKEVIRIILGKF